MTTALAQIAARSAGGIAQHTRKTRYLGSTGNAWSPCERVDGGTLGTRSNLDSSEDRPHPDIVVNNIAKPKVETANNNILI